ncbi:MAG TPA: amino acid ABC transporter ATP-binding protein [Acidimicrobiales bacterium]|nr:amino acid ABC transporter ATP-binding protein [Acidimicrobiales bacterium]
MSTREGGVSAQEQGRNTVTGAGAGSGGSTDAGFVLRAIGVHKCFGPLEVLRGVDLAVSAHEVVCLIGSSGSGKSTLLRCCNLLERIDSGTIELFGHDLGDERIDEDRVRRYTGMVFQSFNLFPHLSVLDNVTLAPRRVLGLQRGVSEQRARELLSRIGLADKASEFPERLSGGQQQRVAIVRSLAMNPRLLLLDEVTSALDPELVAEVLDLVRELAHQGMTMLIATHEMGFAREVANSISFLEDGVIVESGPPERIFGDPTEPATRRFLQRVVEAGRL